MMFYKDAKAVACSNDGDTDYFDIVTGVLHVDTMLNDIIFWSWVGLGRVLWHINHSWLFNAKSSFCIYIKYMICKHIL